MTVNWLDELGAPTDEERFSEARSYFPPCYSNSFDECITSKNLTTFPNCARMKELWTTNTNDPVYKKLDTEVQKLPYCPVPRAPAAATSKTSNLVGVAVAGALGLVVGLLIAGARA